MKRSHLLPLVVIAALVGLLVVWGGKGQTGSQPGPSVSGLDTPTQQVLAKLSLQSEDLADGQQLLFQADAVKLIQPSLAFCDQEFSSEAQRLIRRLTSVQVGGKAIDFYSDVTQYESVEAALFALFEFEDIASGCDAEFVDASQWSLTDDALVVRSASGFAGYLVRGNTLVHLDASHQLFSEDEFRDLLEKFAKRLMEIDPVEVGFF